MDLESRIELQKIDCNCNDCKFMERDLVKHKKSVELHHKWQLDYFNTIKNKMIEKSNWWKYKGEIEKAENLMKEVKKMKFQFDKSTASINFGKCTKFKKDVSFIPNICQLETQGCFEHRRLLASVIKSVCNHPWEQWESIMGDGVLCRKCNTFIKQTVI